MTEFEKKQPLNVFIEAGRKAYRILIHISNNPYDKNPYRDLWDKGWRQERRKADGINPFQRAAKPSDKPANGSFRRPKSSAAPIKVVHTPWKGGKWTRRDAKPKETVLTDKLVSRFNRRHQTAS